MSKYELMSVSVPVTVSHGAATYTTTSQGSSKIFTVELLKIFASLNKNLVSSNSQHSLMTHLAKASYRRRATVDYSYLTGLAEALESGDFSSWVGKPISKLAQEFLRVQNSVSKVSPANDHMSFVLHKLGQPILPNTKVGWGHIRDFN
jgi:hypothetical protein